MTAIKLFILFAGSAAFIAAWVLSKSREHALLEKAKHQVRSLDFWKNAFAIVGVVLSMIFIFSWLFGGSGD